MDWKLSGKFDHQNGAALYLPASAMPTMAEVSDNPIAQNRRDAALQATMRTVLGIKA
jgi:hypothetical protein